MQQEVNRPENKDRTRNNCCKGVINRTANNHNNNIIDKESKVETQENKPVEKETLNVNIQTSHVKKCKYPPNTNKRDKGNRKI